MIEKITTFSIRLEESKKKALESIAREDNRSLNSLIGKIINKYLEENKKRK